MTNSPFHPFPAAENVTDHPVTHETIANRAREIWAEQGCPENCDEAIWLEAEAELLAIHRQQFRYPHLELQDAGGAQPRKDSRYV